MGIKNFQTYIEKFFGHACFKEFAVHDVCYRIKDFARHEIIRPVLGPMVNDRLPEDYDSGYDRCGVYFDMASFMYGSVMKALENTAEYARILTSVENAADDSKMVVCELDKDTIRQIVNECMEHFVRTYAPLLLKAYRIYLAYDTFIPQSKLYEQTCRKKRMKFSLSSRSREACYRDIVNALRHYVLAEHVKTLRQTMDRLLQLADSSPPYEETIRKAVEQQFSSYTTPFRPDAPFTVGEGEWKCFYRIHRDITDGVVDVCYVFGHDWDIGLAMTLYQHPTVARAIKYVYGPTDAFEHTRLLDEKERMLHFICLALFGNDYVGGLVNLSEANATLLKTELDSMYRGDVGGCTSEQVDYLSRVVFKTEQQLSVSEEVEDNDEVETGKLSRAFATVVARLLAAVYGNVDCAASSARTVTTTKLTPDIFDDVLYYADIGPYAHRPGPSEHASELRKHLSRQRRMNEEKVAATECQQQATTTKRADSSAARYRLTKRKKTVTDENTLLTCRDAHGHRVTRTLQQCMDSFALETLWYLSYALFYFRSPTGREQMWMARHDDVDLTMHVGLRMGPNGTFRYDDTRLSKRYDLCRLLELKSVLQNINCCNLYWIIEGAFHHALTSKKQ